MKLRMLIELDINPNLHGTEDDDERIWFVNTYLSRGELELNSPEVDAYIGTVRVIEVEP